MLPTKYQQECRKRYEQDPELWGRFYNPDGTRRFPVKKTIYFKSKTKIYNILRISDIPPEELKKLPKSKPKKMDKKKDKGIEIDGTEKIEVIGTQVKVRGKEVNIKIEEIPENCDRKTYNRLWMKNYRAKKRLQKLKNKYGINLDPDQ